MVIKTKFNIGDTVYMIQDPKQRGYDVVGIKVKPGNAIVLELDYLGDMIEMFDFQVSLDKDPIKYLSFEDNKNDDD